jgi:oligoribonuclease NrnB/cAMP/cGMP phosphodiesterase (DHH superfamily)
MAWLQLSHNDLDGIGCMLLGRRMGVKYSYPCSYDEKSKYYFKTVLSDFSYLFGVDVDGLLITDINITPNFQEHLEAVLPSNIRVITVDHHEDSIREHGRFKIHHNTEICATQIMFNLLKEKINVSRYTDFVEAVNAFDTWHFELSPFALDLQRIFYYYVFMEEKFKYVKWFQKLNDFIDLVQETPPTRDFKPTWYSNFLNLYENKKGPLIDPIIQGVKNVGGINVYTFSKNNFAPAFEISVHALNVGVDNFVLIFEDDTTYTISLRTNSVDGPMLNEYALQKDGGGHRNAASFRIPLDNTLLAETLEEVSIFYNGGLKCDV